MLGLTPSDVISCFHHTEDLKPAFNFSKDRLWNLVFFLSACKFYLSPCKKKHKNKKSHVIEAINNSYHDRNSSKEQSLAGRSDFQHVQIFSHYTFSVKYHQIQNAKY